MLKHCQEALAIRPFRTPTDFVARTSKTP
ncbi:UNVERIFIED_CONTAM: hypothetical protein GTU68_021287 [Idotea baltica]|nr:hypothetical protein [Idotea baltica]